MRLIDADAIHYCFYDLDNYHSFRAVTDDEIAEMPTIEAEPVKRGKWLAYPSDFYMKCSVCGREYEKQRMPQEVGWCPNPKCGAKMDLED